MALNVDLEIALAVDSHITIVVRDICSAAPELKVLQVVHAARDTTYTRMRWWPYR